MSGVELFAQGEWSIRILATNPDEPWFVAADVAKALGYRDAATAVRMLDNDERGTHPVRTPSGEQQMVVISEPGLYSLVLRSQREEAKAFRRWVTHDVLPVVRRSGGQVVDPTKISRTELAQWVIDAEARVGELEVKVAELEPSAGAWDNLVDARGDVSMGDAAKILATEHGVNIGQNRLYVVLEQWGWIFRGRGDRKWRARQEQVDAGRLAQKPQSHYHPSTGELVVDVPQVRVSMKGIAEIRRRMGDSRALASVS